MSADPARQGLVRPPDYRAAIQGEATLVVMLSAEQVEAIETLGFVDIELRVLEAHQRDGLLTTSRPILDVVPLSTGAASEAGVARPAVRLFLGTTEEVARG